MRRNKYLPSIASIALAISVPTFGCGNDMRSVYKAKPKSQCSSDGSKPNNKRLKVKLARKQNLKNRKK